MKNKLKELYTFLTGLGISLTPTAKTRKGKAFTFYNKNVALILPLKAEILAKYTELGLEWNIRINETETFGKDKEGYKTTFEPCAFFGPNDTVNSEDDLLSLYDDYKS